MDIDDLDQILLDDYEIFDGNDNQRAEAPKTTFDPLAPSSPSADARNVAPPLKKRRQFKKLDADLLLSSKGLPRIRTQAPLIKFFGKGYEDADLRKLMDYYQMWAHNLYPRLQFRDFTRTIMKATANSRVKQELQTWQDEHREKTGERERMLAEIEGEGEDPFDDTNNPQQSDNDHGGDEDDEEGMHEVFMDYLVGVRNGTIPIEDAPTTATTASASTTINPPAFNLPSSKDNISDDDDDDDDNLFIRSATNVNRPPSNTTTTATKTTPAPSTSSTTSLTQAPVQSNNIHDPTDDEDEPLFLTGTQRKKRRIQVEEDEDMSE